MNDKILTQKQAEESSKKVQSALEKQSDSIIEDTNDLVSHIVGRFFEKGIKAEDAKILDTVIEYSKFLQERKNQTEVKHANFREELEIDEENI